MVPPCGIIYLIREPFEIRRFLCMFDEIFAHPEDEGYTPEQVKKMRAKLAPLTVGKPIEWTLDKANDPKQGGESYFEMRIPVNCVSNSALKASNDKDLATTHTKCKP